MTGGEPDRRARGSAAVLFACGATIFVTLAALAWLDTKDGTPAFLALVGSAGLAYLVATLQIGRGRVGGRRALIGCLLLALLFRIPLMLEPVGVQTDIYRYLFDARLQRHGINPYDVRPSDPAVAHVHTRETRLLNNPDVPTIYPPGAQLFFRCVTAVDESVRAMKVALVLCDLLTGVIVWSLLASAGRSPWWVLAYAWNPLVPIEVARNGHLDALGVLLLSCSIYFLTRRRTLGASLTLALAVAVKFLPIVLAPLFVRRVRLRDAAIAAAGLLALYTPFLSDGRLPIGSVPAVVDRFRFNGPFFEQLSTVAGPWPATLAATLAGLAVAAVARTRLPPEAPAAWAWPMAAALVLSPLLYPWYLLWVVPFLTVLATVPLRVWTVSILLTYIVWNPATAGAHWRVPAWVLWIEFGSLAVAGLWVLARRSATPAHGQA